MLPVPPPASTTPVAYPRMTFPSPGFTPPIFASLNTRIPSIPPGSGLVPVASTPMRLPFTVLLAARFIASLVQPSTTLSSTEKFVVSVSVKMPMNADSGTAPVRSVPKRLFRTVMCVEASVPMKTLPEEPKRLRSALLGPPMRTPSSTKVQTQ